MKSQNPVKTAKHPAKITSQSVLTFSKWLLNGRMDANANFVELFDLASAFGFENLKSTCILVISHTMRNYDPFEVFYVANFHGSEELKAASFSAIQKQNLSFGNGFKIVQRAVSFPTSY